MKKVEITEVEGRLVARLEGGRPLKIARQYVLALLKIHMHETHPDRFHGPLAIGGLEFVRAAGSGPEGTTDAPNAGRYFQRKLSEFVDIRGNGPWEQRTLHIPHSVHVEVLTDFEVMPSGGSIALNPRELAIGRAVIQALEQREATADSPISLEILPTEGAVSRYVLEDIFHRFSSDSHDRRFRYLRISLLLSNVASGHYRYAADRLRHNVGRVPLDALYSFRERRVTDLAKHLHDADIVIEVFIHPIAPLLHGFMIGDDWVARGDCFLEERQGYEGLQATCFGSDAYYEIFQLESRVGGRTFDSMVRSFSNRIQGAKALSKASWTTRNPENLDQLISGLLNWLGRPSIPIA